MGGDQDFLVLMSTDRVRFEHVPHERNDASELLSILVAHPRA